jgi:hypothetical protein
MTFLEFINQVALNPKIYVDDSEIDEPDDYECIIKELFDLSDGELLLKHFLAKEENDVITIELTVNNQDFSFEAADQSRLAEDSNLVREINKIIKILNIKKRFYTFWSIDSFGQELAFLYSDINTAKKIYNFAKDHNSKVTEYIQQYQISDGTHEEGYDDI